MLRTKARRLRRIVIVRYAPDPLAESRCPEVHQQAQRQVHQSQIGQHLLGMHRGRALDRLELDQQRPLDQKVGTKSFVENDAVQPDRNRLLALDDKPALDQVMREHGLVNGFEQTRPQPLVNLEPAIDGNRRQPLDIHPFWTLRWPIRWPVLCGALRSWRCEPMADDERRVRRLQVATMRPEDSGRGIARLPRSLMAEMGLAEGDVIELVGKRSTPARAVGP